MTPVVKRKRPLLKPHHRRARMEFAERHLEWTIEDWKKVIWSDETKINCLGSDGRKYVWKDVRETIYSIYNIIMRVGMPTTVTSWSTCRVRQSWIAASESNAIIPAFFGIYILYLWSVSHRFLIMMRNMMRNTMRNWWETCQRWEMMRNRWETDAKHALNCRFHVNVSLGRHCIYHIIVIRSHLSIPIAI